MTEDNRTVPSDASHSSGITLPENLPGASPRKINPVTAVHTKGNEDEIKLPEAKNDIISDAGAPRFIKTGNVPKVNVHTETPVDTDVEKFTDRLSVRPQQRMRTGYTGKIRTYADTHAAPADRMKRMIMAENSEFSELSDTSAVTPTDGFSFNADDADTTETVRISRAEADEMSERLAHEATKEIADGVSADEMTDSADAPTKKLTPKGELLREIAGTATDDVPHDPDQLMMDGYDGDGDGESDGVREEALRETRAKKINNFHFWNKTHAQSGDENADEKFSSVGGSELPDFLQNMSDRFSGLDSSFTPVGGEEYSDPENRKTVFKNLIKTRNNCLFRAAGAAFLGLILLIIDISVSVSASKNGGFFALLGGNSLVYNIVNSVFLALAAVLMLPDLKAGAASLLKIHPKADTSLLFTFIFAAIQNAALYSTSVKTEFDLHLMTPAAILVSVPYLVSKLFFYDSTRQCFKAVSAKSDKSYLRKVSDVNLVKELLRDSEADESVNVVYAGKTKFIGAFLSRSADSATAAMPASRLVLICAGVAVLLGLAGGILGKSFAAAATAAALTAVCSFPVGCAVSLGKLLADENKKLSLKSSFVQSYADARDFSCVDDIVIDDSDVIKAEVTKCISAKNVKEKQAMFVAGSLTSVSGGLLKKAFASGVAGFEERMPAVDGLVYEDKLGVSAWVSGCKILLGSHALLENHNVGVPDETIVNTLIEDGCKPVYLAIEGRFAALFSVKYTPLTGVAANLGELANNGSNILISTVDSNITDAYAEQLLSLPADSVRTLPKKVTDKIVSARTAVTDSEEAGIVFGDSVDSLCRCAAAAIRLDSAKRIAKLIGAGASVVGLVISAFLVLTGAYAKTSPLVPLVLQIIWTAFCVASPALFANTSKPRKRKALKKDPQDAKDDILSNNVTSNNTPSAVRSDDFAASAQPADGTAETESTETNTQTAAKTSSNDAANNVNTEEDDTSDDPISKETYSALDAFAEEQERAERKTARAKRSVGKADKTADIDETDSAFAYSDDGDSENGAANTAANGFSAVSGKIKKVFAGIFSRSNENDEDYDDEDGNETDGDIASNNDNDSDFTLNVRTSKKSRPKQTAQVSETRKGILIPDGDGAPKRKAKVTYNTADEIEAAYERKKDEDARVREIFTAPKMPNAPHYEIGAKPTEDAKFVPPTNTGSVNVFDDSVFSPFEDDKIFAGLHESNPPKFDF